MNCEGFKLKDLGSEKFYHFFYQDNNWFIHNQDGEAIEIANDKLFTLIDNYFKDEL